MDEQEMIETAFDDLIKSLRKGTTEESVKMIRRAFEFAVGRGSRKSVALSFDELQPKNGKWTPLKFIGIIGCYMLMMFYTTVGGWLMYYCYKGIRGSFVNASSDNISTQFSQMLTDVPTMLFWTILICDWLCSMYVWVK